MVIGMGKSLTAMNNSKATKSFEKLIKITKKIFKNHDRILKDKSTTKPTDGFHSHFILTILRLGMIFIALGISFQRVLLPIIIYRIEHFKYGYHILRKFSDDLIEVVFPFTSFNSQCSTIYEFIIL